MLADPEVLYHWPFIHPTCQQNPTVWPFDIMVHVSGTACRDRAVETRLIFLVYLLNNIE